MVKYIDADKLSKAIEEKGLDCSFALKMERLDTLALIDELKQEQPEMDLEKEYQEFCKDYPFPWSSQYVNGEYIDELCLSVARHFYELARLSARKEDKQ